jgi:hypothetical protein
MQMTAHGLHLSNGDIGVSVREQIFLGLGYIAIHNIKMPERSRSHKYIFVYKVVNAPKTLL